MHLPDPASGRDRLLLRGGVVLMVAGVIVAIVGVLDEPRHHERAARRTTRRSLGDHRARGHRAWAAALFLRYSIAHFLRFWLARLSWEQQAQTDRLVEALGSGTATRTNEPAA